MEKNRMIFMRVKGAKVQTCVLPQSDFQSHCVQSRTHFYTLYSHEDLILFHRKNSGFKLCSREGENGGV